MTSQLLALAVVDCVAAAGAALQLVASRGSRRKFLGDVVASLQLRALQLLLLLALLLGLLRAHTASHRRFRLSLKQLMRVTRVCMRHDSCSGCHSSHRSCASTSLGSGGRNGVDARRRSRCHVDALASAAAVSHTRRSPARVVHRHAGMLD